MISDTELDLQNVHDNETVALTEIHALQDSDADTVTLTVVQTRQESEQTEIRLRRGSPLNSRS